MTGKPPYSIPSMADIASVRGTNGYTMVSTFSGCGGSCLGFEMAGFKVAWANEFVQAARETYIENHPGVIVDGRDIREVTGGDILDAIGLDVGQVDVLEGSPPCASFSTAGIREKGWGRVKAYSDTSQRADDLFFEYARLLGEIRPRTFVAENVSGLVKGKAIGYFKLILAELRSHGYAVEAKVLDASYLGVPQSRQRVIFVGVRSDLVDASGVGPAFPSPLPYRYSISDVLPDLQPIGTSKRIMRPDEPSPTILTHSRPYTQSELTAIAATPIDVDPETGQDIRLDGYAIAAEWDKIRPGEQSTRYFQLTKPGLNEPVGTITANGASSIGTAGVTHPLQRRKFTLKELRLLSSFPADFVLTGTYAQRWERIGRSVPPVMARAIAEAIRDKVLDRLPGGRHAER